MKPQHNNLYGITFMIVNIISVAILYAVFKTVSKTMPSTQAVFLYKLLLLICITPWALSNGLKGLKTPQLKLHMIRGFFSTGGGLCFMYGLKHVDLANASALQYLQHVIVISIGFIYFKEKITKTKIAGIIMSFSAAILIVFPNLITDLRNFFNSDLAKNNDFNYYYLFILAAVLFWAANDATIKILGKNNAKNKLQAFYNLLFSVIYAFPVAFLQWGKSELYNIPVPIGLENPFAIVLTTQQATCIIGVAFLYFIHVLAYFLAFKYAEISVLMPFQYSSLVFNGLLGFIIFGEIPSKITSYVGYGLIMTAGLMLVRGEHRKRKKAMSNTNA